MLLGERLRATRVDLLQHRDGGGGLRGGIGTRAGEAGAEQQLFILFVELQNLQDPAPRFFQLFPGFRIADRGGWDCTQSGERTIEFFEQRSFAINKRRIWRPLMLSKKTVFLEDALVNLVAEPMVIADELERVHGVAPVDDAGEGVAACLPVLVSNIFVSC